MSFRYVPIIERVFLNVLWDTGQDRLFFHMYIDVLEREIPNIRYHSPFIVLLLWWCDVVVQHVRNIDNTALSNTMASLWMKTRDTKLTFRTFVPPPSPWSSEDPFSYQFSSPPSRSAAKASPLTLPKSTMSTLNSPPAAPWAPRSSPLRRRRWPSPRKQPNPYHPSKSSHLK